MKIVKTSVVLILTVLFCTALNADVINGSAEIQGPDLKLGLNDGRSKGIVPYQRALVHDNGDVLRINYANDFEGGTRVDGDVGFGINPDGNYPYRFNAGAHGGVNLFGSSYALGVTNVVTSGRTGYIAYTTNDWLNGAGNNAHFLSLYPYNIDPSKNGDRQWKAFRLRVGSSAEDKFWVNLYGEGYFGGKVDVAGTLRAEEVIVETGWADFVFEDGYELRSLDEVEAHISEYGHLPDVPSAETIQEDGLEVAKAQTIMMQKIEELTLYTIEQQKQLEQQQALIEKLFEIVDPVLGKD